MYVVACNIKRVILPKGWCSREGEKMSEWVCQLVARLNSVFNYHMRIIIITIAIKFPANACIQPFHLFYTQFKNYFLLNNTRPEFKQKLTCQFHTEHQQFMFACFNQIGLLSICDSDDNDKLKMALKFQHLCVCVCLRHTMPWRGLSCLISYVSYD